MNNIEIRTLKGLKAGMSDKEINEIKNNIKNKKSTSIEKNTSIDDDIIVLEDAVHPLNLMRDIPDSRDYKLNADIVGDGTLPFIDHTDKMSPVKNQGHLGSCVGFAVTAMKEWQELIEHEKEVAEGKKYRRQDEYDLSEAWVYWNCKKIDPWPNSEGTSIRCAMQVLNKIGIPCEKAYPYSDQYEGSPKSWAKLIAKWGLIDSYWRCSNLNDLKVGLQSGPVVIGIACFEDIFLVGSNGIVSYPSNPDNILGGHAICVVGYNDNTKLVKFKNSWGKGWGENGYGYLTYEYINDFMWDAWIAKDLQVTRKIIQERGKDELI
jgi:hypothetical protein